MAFLIIFDLNESDNQDKLTKKFSEFGDVKFVKLEKNSKNNDGSFIAKIEFKKLDKEKELIKYLDSNKINYYSKDIKKSFCKKSIKNTTNNTQQNNRRENKIDISNPSFYYYKDNKYGKDIEEFILDSTYESIFKIDDAKTFELTTTYPGLLIGSGYNHPKLKNDNDDYQLGFFFDHTTGLPVISGSSVKGVLRSIIPDKGDTYYKQKVEFFNEEYDLDFSDNLIEELFDNNAKIIFYDAFIVSPKNKKIFGSDYITSHYSDEVMGEFKNPNPVKFLKILPEVTFRFQFQAEQKYVDLFEKIILDFGIGAKTNVGYGQFKTD